MEYTIKQLMGNDDNDTNAAARIIHRYEIDWMSIAVTPCTCDYFYFLNDGGKEEDYKIDWDSECQTISGFYSDDKDESDHTQKEAKSLFYAMISTFGMDENNVNIQWLTEKDEYNRSDFVITIQAHLPEKSGYIYNFGFKLK